jgi:hypothetical protein
MSIVLAQEFVSSNEAYIKWTVDPSLISPSTKGFIYLTDVSQFDQNLANGFVVTAFPIIKYQLRSSELSSGSHIFEGLTIGNYISEINIINGTTSITSDPLSVQVFYLAKPEVSTIIPGSTKFTITLAAPTSSVQTVTFILLGKQIVAGITQVAVTNTETVVFPYSSDNTYVINNVVNNNEYELACFYTSSNGISSAMSDTLVETPTNTPNQITVLAAIYSSVGQTLTITHNMPNNAADYDLIDLRATITDSNNNVTYYYSSENSALLSPVPTASSSVVFNMNNQNLLPTDLLFTVTLSAKNELNIWGPVESPTIYCVHPLDYFAVALLNTDLSFNVGLNSIDITDNLTYPKNTNYVINYTANVFQCDAQGAIIGSAIASKTQTNLNFNFNELTAGFLYKVVFNLKYTYNFPNSMSVIIQQKVQNTCFYYFIPHDTPNQLSLTATSDDQNVVVSWPAISVENLRGFLLDHYEVSSDNVSWVNKAATTNHTFDTLNNGTSYTFYVRAVSVSDNMLYINETTVNGATADITSIPYGSPDTPMLVSQLPGDTKCTVVWKLTTEPYNGGLFNKFQASINSAPYVDISPAVSNAQYTLEFDNLINLQTNSIQIKLVTNNQSATNNIDTIKSSNFIVTTIPFSMPSTPTGLVISPDTNSVVLNWNAVTPSEIIDSDVEYELYYKLASDSDYTIISNIATNAYTITGLTSNLVYNFKIRSTIINTETSFIFYSDFTSVYQGRAFIYANAPVMILEAAHTTITAKLSPNTNNFFQTAFKYHATITDMDGNNARNMSVNNVTNGNVQSIMFTVLGDSSSLVDLTIYKIVAYYEMLNTDNSLYYSSNTTTNQIEPYNLNLAPILTSVSGNQTVVLTWDVSAFVGYSITNYQLSFDNVSWAIIDANTISQIGLNMLTVSISLDQSSVALQNGQQYNFYIRALLLQNNIDMFSSASNMVTNIPYTNPTIPTNIQTVPGDQTVTFSWSAPSNFGGLGLDHYEVKRSGMSDWIDVGLNTSRPFTGLTNGQEYICYIRTVTINVLENNTLIYSSSASNPNVPYTRAIAATNRGGHQMNGFVNYIWNVSPDYLGGLTNFRSEVSRDNVNWVSTGISTNTAIYGLTNGIPSPQIYVRIVTIHPYLGDIIGATYIPSLLVPHTRANAPIFDTCDQGDSQLLFAWTVPASLGGLSLDHYEVSLNNVDWINAQASVSYLFIELTNGSNYTLYARAVTTHPNLGPVVGATFTSSVFVPYKLPSAPTLNTINYQGNCVFNLDSNLFGLPLDYYEVSFNNENFTKDIVPWMNNINHTINIEPVNLSLQLTYGTTYSFQFRSRSTHPNLGSIIGNTFNINFIPYNSDQINLNYPPAASSVPSSEQVILNWNAVPVENYGGLQFDHYAVGIGPDTGSVNWINVGSNLTYTFDQLTNGQDYTFVIKSVFYRQYDPVNVYKSSNNTVVQNMPYDIPAAPTHMAAIPGIGDGSVNFTWDKAQPVMGARPFLKYQISADNIIWEEYQQFADINVSHFSKAGPVGIAIPLYARIVTTHPYLNEIFGQSSFASNIPYRIAAAPDLISNPESQQIQLSWNTPILGGLDIDHYEISYDNESTWSSLASNSLFVTSPTSSSVTFKLLNNGTTYTYYIKAITLHPILGLIVGTSSNVSAVPFLKPGAVSNIIASTINNSMVFSFTPPGDVNNNILTQYYEYSIDNFVTINPLFQFTSLTIPINDDPFSLNIRSYILNPNDNITHVSGDYTTLSNLQNINVTTPQNLQASIKSSEVTLTWTAVPGVTFQVIKYVTTGSNVKYTVTGSSYTFSGLTNGSSYNFGVCMLGGGISGPVSNISATPITVPSVKSITKNASILYFDIDFGGAPSINVILDISISFSTTYQSGLVIVSVLDTMQNINNTNIPQTVNLIPFTLNQPDYNYVNFTVINAIGSVSGTKFL